MACRDIGGPHSISRAPVPASSTCGCILKNGEQTLSETWLYQFHEQA